MILKLDLKSETVTCNNRIIHFKIEKNLKERLLNGLDDIELTLKYEKKISAYEENINKKFKWKEI